MVVPKKASRFGGSAKPSEGNNEKSGNFTF